MNDFADQQRRTARLVRVCYAHYVAPVRVTPEQLYALCQLTWITKGGPNLDDRLADNTRKVIAPALMVLTGADISATAMDELPEQLKEAKAPTEITRLLESRISTPHSGTLPAVGSPSIGAK